MRRHSLRRSSPAREQAPDPPALKSSHPSISILPSSQRAAQTSLVLGCCTTTSRTFTLPPSTTQRAGPSPLCSILVPFLEPLIVNGLPITTCSSYVSGPTLSIDPDGALSMASVRLSPSCTSTCTALCDAPCASSSWSPGKTHGALTAPAEPAKRAPRRVIAILAWPSPKSLAPFPLAHGVVRKPLDAGGRVALPPWWIDMRSDAFCGRRTRLRLAVCIPGGWLAIASLPGLDCSGRMRWASGRWGN